MFKPVTLREAWLGEADCKGCSLREAALFSGLAEQDFDHIHEPIDQFELRPGTRLYQAGDKGDFMYTIRNGALKLVQYLPDGSQRIVRVVRRADILGLEALLGQAYQHEAIALQHTEVCRLPVKVVRHLSKESPKLHEELLQRWQRALNEADAWLTELSTGSARHRVARLLLRLIVDPMGETEDECELFSREDMGAMLGITTETASRTVAGFKREGLLQEIAGNRYRVDSVRLREIADD